MDTFDSINLGVFVLIQLPRVARMTFWKRNGQLLNFWTSLPNTLLFALSCLDLSLLHHWHMPHRRRYQLVLVVSAMLVTFWKFAERRVKERQKAKEKEAQKAERRYY